LVDRILNNTIPIITVFKGTIEFIIEATALSISFSAKANKKAGKKLPKKADIVIHFHSNLVIFDNLFQAIKIIIIEEKIIRREPN
jgi:uncharacterized phosphosugar-binding protein